jgi:ABC-type sugar transport system ATPase subunit
MLELCGITKHFLNTKALDQVDFSLVEGEVHGLIGPNGAGKSTLMRIVSGLYPPDEGTILFRDNPVTIRSVLEAQKLGISILHQEPVLVPDMSIAENIFLGVEQTFGGIFVKSRLMKQKSNRLLKLLGLPIHPNTLVRKLSYSERFIIAIAKALSVQSKILIMDEPTSCLSETESERLFNVIRKLKREGVAIVYITHRMKEIMQICDRVTIIRDGRNVATMDVTNMTKIDAVKLILGKELDQHFPPILDNIGDTLIKAEGLTKAPFFYGIDFSLREGEILGIAGFMGSGKSELAQTLFEQEKLDNGRVFWRDQEIEFRRGGLPSDFRFGFVNHDRQDEGLFMEFGVKNNLTINALDKLMPNHMVNVARENEAALNAVMELDIKIQHLDQEVKYLSGGNQQKVMLGKLLISECDLYLLDEPARGVDLGTKGEIYAKIHDLAAEGKGVIVFSSDIPELVGLCTRIIVMCQGRVTAEFHHSDANVEQILRYASGDFEYS